MALTRGQKEKLIGELKEIIERQKAMIFVDFGGLKTKNLFALKNNLKEVNSVLRVCKKTLLNLALKAERIALEVKNIKGPLAVVFCLEEEVAPAKAIYQFSQEQANLKILGCFLDNQFHKKDFLIALAQLPSRSELLVRLVGSIAAPLTNLVCVLQSNIKGLIYVLSKLRT